jgi:GT2 family glycosyltransferase
MKFYHALLRTAARRPKLAAEALYWHAMGKKVRARNRLRSSLAQGASAYQDWILWHEKRGEILAEAADDIAGWEHKPRLSVILYNHSGESSAHFERRLAALEAQVFAEFELVLVQSREAVAARTPSIGRLAPVAQRTNNPVKAMCLGLQTATGNYVLPLAEDAILAPDALYHLAKAVMARPDALVFYGDEDRITRRGKRLDPWFKPQWNAELFLAQDYLSNACLVRRDLARACVQSHPALNGAGLYALLLAATSQATDQGVAHVPHVMAHIDAEAPDDDEQREARVAAVAHHLSGQPAQVQAGPYGSVAVEWPLPDPRPLVSVIIPTRDHVELLRTSVSGVLTATRYRNVEVIIMDNGSSDAAALSYLNRVSANPLVRVVRHDAPFNFAQLINIGAREAKGEYLCLLNNDIEVIDEAWLSALMRQAVRPEMGAVGAKLLYDDGSIQHAGVTVGLGQAAGHAHRFQRDSEPGYHARAHLPHYVSAVTAACLLVAKHKFWQVGGMDEEGFQVAFNDVDLCLKLQAAGWRNFYEPRSVLVHHESKSRRKDYHADQISRYMRELALLQERWQTRQFADPLHHPALERSNEAYQIAL